MHKFTVGLELQGRSVCLVYLHLGGLVQMALVAAIVRLAFHGSCWIPPKGISQAIVPAFDLLLSVGLYAQYLPRRGLRRPRS